MHFAAAKLWKQHFAEHSLEVVFQKCVHNWIDHGVAQTEAERETLHHLHDVPRQWLEELERAAGDVGQPEQHEEQQDQRHELGRLELLFAPPGRCDGEGAGRLYLLAVRVRGVEDPQVQQRRERQTAQDEEVHRDVNVRGGHHHVEIAHFVHRPPVPQHERNEAEEDDEHPERHQRQLGPPWGHEGIVAEREDDGQVAVDGHEQEVEQRGPAGAQRHARAHQTQVFVALGGRDPQVERHVHRDHEEPDEKVGHGQAGDERVGDRVQLALQVHRGQHQRVATDDTHGQAYVNSGEYFTK